MGDYTKLTGNKAGVGAVLFEQGGSSLSCERLDIRSTPDGSEQSTGFALPDNAIVVDVWLRVRTAEATGTTTTLDVGLDSTETNGDADGFLAGVDVSSTGIKRGVASVTVGANEDYFDSTTRGALLQDFTAGSDTATDVGTLQNKWHVKNTAETVTYTAGSADWAEFRGDAFVLFLEVET